MNGNMSWMYQTEINFFGSWKLTLEIYLLVIYLFIYLFIYFFEDCCEVQKIAEQYNS